MLQREKWYFGTIRTFINDEKNECFEPKLKNFAMQMIALFRSKSEENYCFAAYDLKELEEILKYKTLSILEIRQAYFNNIYSLDIFFICN